MYRAEILTPWTGIGTDADPFRPALPEAHALASWSDATGTPAEALPGEAATSILVVCTPEVLAAVAADSTYSVLWSEEVATEP